MIAYNCKYTPIELLQNFDDCILLNNSADHFDYAESLLHANLCSHVKALLENIRKNGYQDLCFMNCCTSTAKLFDTVTAAFPESPAQDLPENTPRAFRRLMDLPTENGSCAVEKLKRDLLELLDALEDHYRTPFDPQKFAASFSDAAFAFPQTPYLLLLGARSNPALLSAISDCFAQPVIDMTCANNGRLVSADIRADDSRQDMMEKYAHALLSQIPCMRMSDIQSRKQLLYQENCIGIIYHTIKFCDYYGFEYAALKKEEIPVLKIETDYTTQSAGQLLTRLEGFAENLPQASCTAQQALKETAAEAASPEMEVTETAGIYFAGIDSGSTSTELVILNAKKEPVSTVMVRTGANAGAGARKALEKAGIPLASIKRIVATGYGRKNIDFADASVTEITCHAKGAKHLYPQVRVIIDIGGQDSKVITLDEAGNVTNFVMNDKCAAGTGRFLENMAKVLELDLEEMSLRGLHYKKDLTISSMCTVFAESEVVSLIAENHPAEDIIHGLNKSVAVKTKALAKSSLSAIKQKETAVPSIMMTGGVANNRGVAAELEKQLQSPLYIPAQPEFCGALGAALFAAEGNAHGKIRL